MFKIEESVYIEWPSILSAACPIHNVLDFDNSSMLLRRKGPKVTFKKKLQLKMKIVNF